MNMSTPNSVTAEVLQERRRQIASEGWTADRDDAHQREELRIAAATYLANGESLAGGTVEAYWPWALDTFKPSSYRRNLVKAAALIVAEIERVDRRADG